MTDEKLIQALDEEETLENIEWLLYSVAVGVCGVAALVGEHEFIL